MKAKPGITYWRERAGPGMVACHAVRHWDVPSNGVFLLLEDHEVNGRMIREKEGRGTWERGKDWRGMLATKLEARERSIMNIWKRNYRDHLIDETEMGSW